MLTAVLDRLLAAVAPAWALRRDRARRQRALEQQYDDQAVRWIDGEPWVRSADGMSWLRVPESRPVPPPPAVGPGWRPSAYWTKSPREPGRPSGYQRRP
jgi:hypothetical protein